MNKKGSAYCISLLFAVCVFLGSFLLFAVEPIIGKFILPWFGGSSAVWITAVLFFQTVLFIGNSYCYAVSLLNVKRQGIVHIGVVVATMFVFAATALCWKTPIMPTLIFDESFIHFPTLRVLKILCISIGLPFFVLSTTSSLLQYWYGRMYSEKSPYSFFGLSNAAALLALMLYPFIIEPALTLYRQGWVWSYAYFVYGIGIVFVSFVYFKHTRSNSVRLHERLREEGEKLPVKRYVEWIALATCASIMMLATTNQLTQSIASIPLLWLLPLSLYLISFVVCFTNWQLYNRRIFSLTTLIMVIPLIMVIMMKERIPLIIQIIIYSCFLFSGCIVCHGELYQRRPQSARLPIFYLCVTLGGMVGGIFVSLIAPVIFTAYYEFHIGSIACIAITLLVLFKEKTAGTFFRGARTKSTVRFEKVALCFISVIFIVVLSRKLPTRPVFVQRDFYGLLSIREAVSPDYGPYKVLFNGNIMHGLQFSRNQYQLMLPTTYFSPDSGIGLSLQYHPKRFVNAPMRIGCIGLGIGTLAAYGKEGDYMRFYELNPHVVDIAHKHFTYLKNCRAQIDIVVGDGRLRLQQELMNKQNQNFDILIVDVFNGGTIPMHLLTKESFELYLQHTNRENGIIAINISNKYLNLIPVIKALSRHFDLTAAIVDTGEESEYLGNIPSRWALLTKKRAVFDKYLFYNNLDQVEDIPLWSDSFSNLFDVLRLW